MRYKFLAFVACFLILACSIAEAQNMRKFRNRANARYSRHGIFQFTGGIGISSYFGDLKDNAFNLRAKPSIQLGAQYRVNNNLHIRSEIMWYRIVGADTLNDIETSIYDRNLSFRADNVELNVVALWYLFNKFARRNRPVVNPYAFAGVGISTNSPKAFYQDEWHALRPLQTEGVQYGAVVFALPAGFGVTYHISNNWDISAEWGYRITFSDYLDDASTDYRNQDTFTNDLARKLSDRRNELGRPARYQGDKYRGNPGNNDWYMITGLKATFTPGPAGMRRYRRPKYRR